jgi:hypothetical protein
MRRLRGRVSGRWQNKKIVQKNEAWNFASIFIDQPLSFPRTYDIICREKMANEVSQSYIERLDPLSRFEFKTRSTVPSFELSQIPRLLNDFDDAWKANPKGNSWFKQALEITVRLPALLEQLEGQPEILREICRDVFTPKDRDPTSAVTAKEEFLEKSLPLLVPAKMSEVLLTAYDSYASTLGGGDATLFFRVDLVRRIMAVAFPEVR